MTSRGQSPGAGDQLSAGSILLAPWLCQRAGGQRCFSPFEATKSDLKAMVGGLWAEKSWAWLPDGSNVRQA